MANFCWEIRKLSQSEQSCKLIVSYARSCCAGEILWWWCLCMNHCTRIVQAVWLPSRISFAVDLCDQGPVKVGFRYILFFFGGPSEFLISHQTVSLGWLIPSTPEARHPAEISAESCRAPGLQDEDDGLLSLLTDRSVMLNKSLYFLGPLWPSSLPTAMSPFTTVVWKVLHSRT